MTQVFRKVLSIALTCLIFFTLAESIDAQVSSPAPKERVKIALKDEFSLTLRFDQYPRYAFDLWLPELAIFDADNDRSTVAEPIDGVWLAKRHGNLQVRGQLSAGNKQMEFRCTFIPLTASSLMLELEVKNTGQSDWTDYTQLAVCLAPAENNQAFSDTSGHRSYINLPDAGLQPITRAGDVRDFNHYVVGNLHDPSDSIQRSRVQDGFVARTSTSEKTTISFMWEKSARVDVNPGGLDCIHSHPAVGPLKAGESKTLNGFILLQNGRIADHYTLQNDLINQQRSGL